MGPPGPVGYGGRSREGCPFGAEGHGHRKTEGNLKGQCHEILDICFAYKILPEPLMKRQKRFSEFFRFGKIFD